MPKTIDVPLLVIHQGPLLNWLSVLPQGSVATPIYTQKWTEKLIKANLDHTKLPASPPPKRLP